MTTGTCDENSLWNIKKIIHKGQCRNPYEVSDKDGGLLPSCEGKEDGNYSNDFGGYYIHFGQYTKDYFRVGRKCDAYYQCKGGVATAVKCPNGTTFESLSRSCKPGNHSIGLGCHFIVIQVSICTVFQTNWQSVNIRSCSLTSLIYVKTWQRSIVDRVHRTIEGIACITN